MKIAYLVNSYPAPSHSFIRREIQAVERRGIEVHRFAMRSNPNLLVDPADFEELERTEYVLAAGAMRLLLATIAELFRAPQRFCKALHLAMVVGRRSEHGILRHFLYFVEACRIAQRCRELQVGFLHAHFGTNSAAVAMFAAALGGPSYSFTVHGPEEFDSPISLSLGEKVRRAAFTVAISSFGRSQLCRWVNSRDWGRIHIVRCGIEPALFPEPEPIPAQGIRVVAIGRLAEQKGQLVLVEALARAIETHPALHLTLVGDGPMREEIEAAIRKRGLESHVTITGWVDDRRVRRALDEAHALVLPSFAEGLPVVLMEAMAAGRPVIATFVAGIPELVQPGETGWMVPAGDVSALGEALCSLADTPRERLEQMGRAGRARVFVLHDIDREAGKLAGYFGAHIGATPSAEEH